MQQTRYSRYFTAGFILIDLLLIAGVLVALYFTGPRVRYTETENEQNAATLLLVFFFWILLSGRTRLYEIPRTMVFTLYAERIFTHIFIFLGCILLMAKVSNNNLLQHERLWTSISLFTVLFMAKTLIFFLLKYLRAKGVNHRNIMFLAENSTTEILKNIILNRKDYGYKIFEFSHESEDLGNLKKFWKKNGIDTVFLPAENSMEKTAEEQLFKAAMDYQVKVSLLPELVRNDFFEYDLNYLETHPVLTPTEFPLSRFSNSFLKRSFDLVFALLVLVLVGSWLFPVVSLLIMWDSKGRVFFVQKRYGFKDRIFNCIKFRTMVENEGSSSKTTAVNDQRITRIGRFLRKTSLDEMPQFLNVLRGDMSVVGPRPHMLLVDDYYKTRIGRYAVRSLVKPGITGLAQVNGLRGDNGNVELEMKKRIMADSFYVKNWSLVLDLVIILKTVYLLIKGDQKAH